MREKKMNFLRSEEGYSGPATLVIDGPEFRVEVRLRGQFQPIDGRYHWYGRITSHDGLTTALGSARASGVLSTPEGSAACELSDRDPWGRYRVTGVSGAPYATPGYATPPG
jgi:hypothetical protein